MTYTTCSPAAGTNRRPLSLSSDLATRADARRPKPASHSRIRLDDGRLVLLNSSSIVVRPRSAPGPVRPPSPPSLSSAPSDSPPSPLAQAASSAVNASVPATKSAIQLPTGRTPVRGASRAGKSVSGQSSSHWRSVSRGCQRRVLRRELRAEGMKAAVGRGGSSKETTGAHISCSSSSSSLQSAIRRPRARRLGPTPSLRRNRRRRRSLTRRPTGSLTYSLQHTPPSSSGRRPLYSSSKQG